MLPIRILADKIKTKYATIGIIGVGYVGSAIGKSAASVGYPVTGYDVSSESIARVNALRMANFSATDRLEKVAGSDIVCICVPTPISDKKIPDLSLLHKAINSISKYVHKDQLIILESTVSPGTTRNVVLPLLAQSGLRPEQEFFLAFSPERINPGSSRYPMPKIPKLVGGLTVYSTYLASKFYQHIVEKVYPVSSPEVAEMSKMLENTFRLVNISLLNEISQYTKKVGIDILEVIAAANTKPFGFMPHYPGPGIGGHCIPVDPYYILDDARKYGINLSLIAQAGAINEKQPIKVVDTAFEIINKTNGIKKKHKVLLLGVAYKPNTDDTRDSPALTILKELENRGVEVSYYDPYVPRLNGRMSISFSDRLLKTFDLMIIVTAHSTGIDYKKMVEYHIPILDTQQVLRGLSAGHIFSLFSDSKTNKKPPADDFPVSRFEVSVS